MRVPLNWLREYCDPQLDTAGIEQRLTMSGTKVETILHHGVPSPAHFVVGRVIAAGPHPNADRLKLCEVEVGGEAAVTIVCGAPNVAAGQTVAVALPGALMPDGSAIKAAKLRGVPSNGMILAAEELEIDTDGSGIMVLDESILDVEPAPGTPLAEVLAICTDVLELEITPNRPDCLGVYGVARELHAATGAPLAPAPWSKDPGGVGPLGGVEIAVECPELCPRFTARAFEDVTIAPSPPWLKARLLAAGQRPINNVVDITNYAMLLCGQPLHAFDLDRVAGARLTIRRAEQGEQLKTLDGQVRTLDHEMVVIEDAEGPTSIAGIMGGERSEVHPGTTRVLMEVANWSGPNIHRTSWALGLRSEASGRFEKGLAPEQCMQAQALATRLMVELCGARVAPGTADLVWRGVPSTTIRLRERRVEAILGMPVSCERQEEILRALDFETTEVPDPVSDGDFETTEVPDSVADGGGALEVIVPALRRNDVTREADLIEEVARIHGLEALPATLPARRGAYGRLSPTQRLQRRALDALVGRGLYEAVGWTFTAPSLHDRLRLGQDDPRRRAPVLENPLSEDQSLLRTTLLGSLLDAAAHNSARGMVDLRLFEVGTLFVLAEDPSATGGGGGAAEGAAALGETGVRERKALAVLLSGRLQPATWSAPDPPRADLFAVKGILEALGAALRVVLECRPGGQPFLHPGRSATVVVGDEPLGWLGELHPLVAREWGIDGAAAMELELDRLLTIAAKEGVYRDVISYPALRQDLAVVLPERVPAAQVLEQVRGAAGELLDDVNVFDVYSGPQVGEGRRSLALSLAFRALDRTLTDEDVAPLRERIVTALDGLGGELRA
jgi:phenylalanyl-tRNA synthetase beta chain